MSNLVIYEKKVSAEDFMNKKIETNEKWNQINFLSMESVLGANFCMRLLYMSNRKIWIEETNQCINKFSCRYMFNPTLYINKVLREQVKACFKKHIWSRYQQTY